MSASCLQPAIDDLQAQITAGKGDIGDLGMEVADLSGVVDDLSGRVGDVEDRPWGVWGLTANVPVSSGTVEVVWNAPEAGTDTTYISAPSVGGYFTVNTPGLYQLEYHHFMGEASPGDGAWSANTRFGSRLLRVTAGAGQTTIYETSAYPPSSGSGGEPSDGGGCRLIRLIAGDQLASSVICNPPGAGTVSNAVIYGLSHPNPGDQNSFFSWRFIQS